MSETITKNNSLTKAKSEKNDEFYTQYQDIEREMQAYLEFNPDVFRGKTILLPCDDPDWSNFTKYFAQNFDSFGLKKLISTSYAPNSRPSFTTYEPSLAERENEKFSHEKTMSNGKIFTLSQDKNGDSKIDLQDLDCSYLEGDGDFRSEEVTKLRDEADIVITNPPFSLFRDYLAWVQGKQFVMIGNMNAITYKEVFPLIQSNQLWLGYGFKAGNAYFEIPVAKEYTTGVYDEDKGLVKFRNCCWFANLRHEPLQLMTMDDNLKHNKKVSRGDKPCYAEYDNYYAIEVSFTDAIPSDYKGVMGVPISFLDKYNPDQFEILGCSYSYGEPKGYLKEGAGHNVGIDGINVYKRIFIKHKK